MAQTITITVEDRKTMAALRKILSLMDGISVSKPKRLTGIEISEQDIREGRTTVCKSSEDMFKQLGLI